jgi:hypothetical protein
MCDSENLLLWLKVFCMIAFLFQVLSNQISLLTKSLGNLTLWFSHPVLWSTNSVPAACNVLTKGHILPIWSSGTHPVYAGLVSQKLRDGSTFSLALSVDLVPRQGIVPRFYTSLLFERRPCRPPDLGYHRKQCGSQRFDVAVMFSTYPQVTVPIKVTLFHIIHFS